MELLIWVQTLVEAVCVSVHAHTLRNDMIPSVPSTSLENLGEFTPVVLLLKIDQVSHPACVGEVA